jgi:hypothetical protein
MAREKRPRDPNALAHYTVGRLTGEIEPPATEAKDPAAVSAGSKGGKKGGKARAAALPRKKRAEIARKAAAARWGNRTTPHSS